MPNPTVVGPVARSPITPAEPVVVRDGWEVSARESAAALTLRDQTPMAKVLVKSDANGAYAAAAVALPFEEVTILVLESDPRLFAMTAVTVKGVPPVLVK